MDKLHKLLAKWWVIIGGAVILAVLAILTDGG
jgi:hypothetical protein